MPKYLEFIFKRGFWVVLLAWVFITYNIKILLGDGYSQDSYTFYFLGKNIIAGNGYYSPTIRDFYLDPTGQLLSRSYPPLFPLLVGITDFLLNKSIAAGRVINLFICIFSLYAWFTISKRISGYLFFIAFLIPIIFSILPSAPLWVDAAAGRSSPLTWLILLAVIHLLLKPSLLIDNKISIGVGIFLGLLTLTRFDTMMFCFAIPIIIYFSIKISLKKIMLMYAALTLTMLPWAIRNYIVFGSFIASSEAITAASTVPGIVPLQFFADGVPLGINNPDLWIQQRLSYLKQNIEFFYSLLSPMNQTVVTGFSTAILTKIVAFLYIPGFIYSFITKGKNYCLWIYFVTSLTWCVFNIISLSLTSYGYEARYYGVSLFLIMGGGSFVLVVIIKKILELSFKNETLPRIENVGIGIISRELILCFILFAFTIHFYSKEIFHNKHDDLWLPWSQLIKNTPVQKGELVATNSAELVSFYTGWNTIYLPLFYADGKGELPANPTFDENYQAWLKHWKPSYLLINSSDFKNPLASYPHATVLAILDKLVLLKINLDEASLTKQDESDDARLRRLWLWRL